MWHDTINVSQHNICPVIVLEFFYFHYVHNLVLVSTVKLWNFTDIYNIDIMV